MRVVERFVFISLVLTASIVLTSSIAAEVPEGEDFQVNTTTASDQLHSSVAVGPDGSCVFVWWHTGFTVTDPALSIRARAVAPDGLPVGPDFQVNNFTHGWQTNPDVAVAPDGTFVVAWQSYDYIFEGLEGGFYGPTNIRGQRHTADGEQIGAAFEINDDPAYGRAYRPAVAADGAGNFIVAWGDRASPDIDPLGGIKARRYHADGTPRGEAFYVNTYTPGPQGSPALAVAPDGRFVVTWGGVQARLFDADGLPIGDQFLVNSSTPDGRSSAVSMDAAGNFVVAWTSYLPLGSDNDGASIHVQRFLADGSRLGDEIQVNAYTTGDQGFPSVHSDAAGNFVVVWASDGSFGSDTGLRSVQARHFTAAGTAIGDQFQVNAYTTGQQYLPASGKAIGAGSGESFVVVWTSHGSFGNDDQYTSVQARRFPWRLFVDDFESGDTTAWSVVVP